MTEFPHRYVDAHCHVDLFPQFPLTAKEADFSGVATIAVTTTPRAWEANLAVSKQYPLIFPALGLHPQLVQTHAAELALWEERIGETRFVGEVGLDAGPRFYKSLNLQKEAFSRILAVCSSHGGKVLSIHSVRAVKVVLDMIESTQLLSSNTAILHWFTGSASDARRAADLGCYFSINAAMIASKSGAELIKTIPSERILTESDGPFALIDGQPSKPTSMPTSIRYIAEALSMTEEELRILTIENFARILNRTDKY